MTITSIFRRVLTRPAPTEAEREVVRDVLPTATPAEVDRVALAARGGKARRVQVELTEAGVKLSAAPPTAYELLRRLGALALALVALGCAGGEEPGAGRRPTWGEIKEMCAQRDGAEPCPLSNTCGDVAIGVSDACICDCAPAPGGGWCCTAP